MNQLTRVLAGTLLALFGSTVGAVTSDESALLVIGASYANGNMPFNDQGEAPLDGISIGYGGYLSLGQALVREPLLSGLVVNEAQAGATTFSRTACNPQCQMGVGWLGYDEQFTRALARVSVVDPVTGEVTLNARYLLVTFANDCLHADAFGVPQSATQPCSLAEVDAFIDRLIAVGQRALALGITPVYGVMPRWEDMDLPLSGELFGISWMVDEASYDVLRARHRARLQAELPGALVLDYWSDFNHGGDGIHPDRRSVLRAARRIAVALLLNDKRH